MLPRSLASTCLSRFLVEPTSRHVVSAVARRQPNIGFDNTVTCSAVAELHDATIGMQRRTWDGVRAQPDIDLQVPAC
jgi:hypothetical protein